MHWKDRYFYIGLALYCFALIVLAHLLMDAQGVPTFREEMVIMFGGGWDALP